ncbi:MAG TPA: nitroreductase/quinone reductase family protein [Longilinea sp.]|nr:nitroreductase/quinone reductase family protein [Longilinea sp.]
MLFHDFVSFVLRSPLHRLLSKATMLVTMTGRKTGTPVTLPVNYIQDGSQLFTISQRNRVWWRNLRGGASVILRLRGQDVVATGKVVEIPAEVGRELCVFVQKRAPAYQKYLKIDMLPDGTPSPASLEKVAQERVFIVFDLTHGNG